MHILCLLDSVARNWNMHTEFINRDVEMQRHGSGPVWTRSLAVLTGMFNGLFMLKGSQGG